MKRLIIFLGGFIGGAAAGWYLGSKIERQRCDIEIESVRREFKKAMDDANNKTKDAVDRAKKAMDDRHIFAEALTRLGYDNEPSVKTVQPESNPIVVDEDEHPSEDDYLLDPIELDIQPEEEIQRNEMMRKKPPELIMETVWAHGHLEGYDQKDLLWYPEDRVMLEADTNELVDNPHSFLGSDWESDIEHETVYSTEGTSYVRNYRWSTDYFIYRCEGLGSDNVSLGDDYDD